MRDSLAAEHFLRNETQAARKAVEALDTYILKLASFQDKALEVIEEAHRCVVRDTHTHTSTRHIECEAGECLHGATHTCAEIHTPPGVPSCAHRALSRLERAVALSAAPELIVVACEIKVACHRGLHLFRTYGK